MQMKVFKNYGLSIVLATLFLVSWVGQAITQWKEQANEAEQHGETLTMEQFMPSFWSATFENWQSEFLQLLSFVMLTAVLIHKGSHESKDTDEEMMERIKAIQKELESIKAQAQTGSGPTQS